ncbi:hypothetical protein VNI00_018618 [Paramarasmius palmivorus]|uniref:Uncharacterized protein n=1 Tax=Paramarasmius palmivorus TaxID=297713 RepID=A0AAW0AWA2_9AGAR
MPRAKLYKSDEAKKRANREKSARYYRRNRDNIKSKNREHIKDVRARMRKQIQAEEYRSIVKIARGIRLTFYNHRVAERRARREEKWRNSTQTEKQYCATHQHFGDLRWRIGSLQNTFDKDLVPSAYRWLDNVYQDCQRRLSSSSPTGRCPLDEASNVLLSYIRSMEKLSDEVINAHGVGKDWRRARQFIKRVRLLLECCYDMEMKILDPDESLEESYTQGQLAFQKPSNRAWIDGLSPLPE